MGGEEAASASGVPEMQKSSDHSMQQSVTLLRVELSLPGS